MAAAEVSRTTFLGLIMNGAIGILGGTFDPPHAGHLDLAESAIKAYELKKVYFVPASVNPLKRGKTVTDAQHRLAMTRLAIMNHPHLTIDDSEILRGGTSYTIDTIRHFSKKFPDKTIYLIIGDDAAAHWRKWKDASKILDIAHLVIGSRLGIIENSVPKADSFPTENLPVSSTLLREKLEKGEDCEGEIPKNVLDYIRQNQLYLLTE